MSERLVDISARKVHQTDKAILIDDGSKEVWLPLSVVEVHDKGRGLIEVTMPEYVAKREGLI